MSKQLVVYPKKCIGCGTCEQICSFVKAGTLEPKYNAITVIVYEEDEFAVPLMCQQCDEAPCAKICPVAALYRSDDGVVTYDDEKCIVCRLCADACPMGNVRYSTLAQKMSKCDRCGGDPKCVSYCPGYVIPVLCRNF